MERRETRAQDPCACCTYCWYLFELGMVWLIFPSCSLIHVNYYFAVLIYIASTFCSLLHQIENICLAEQSVIWPLARELAPVFFNRTRHTSWGSGLHFWSQFFFWQAQITVLVKSIFSCDSHTRESCCQKWICLQASVFSYPGAPVIPKYLRTLQ